MNKPLIQVDFNEMVEPDIVLLSQENTVTDAEGNEVTLFEGQEISVYMPDVDEQGNPDNLVAQGVVIPNTLNIDWTKPAKWLCKIDRNGVQSESDFV